MKTFTLLFLSFGICLSAFAQHSKAVLSPALTAEKKVNTTKSEVLTAHFYGLKKPEMSEKNWNRVMVNKSTPKEIKHKTPNHELLMQIKAQKQLERQQQSGKLIEGIEPPSSAAINPVVGVDFLGNEMYDGTPPDNTIAISNDGKLVSSDNTTIEYYQNNGTYISTYVTHFDFFNEPSLSGNIYDPKVLYDSQADRFIFVILHGTDNTTSQILVAFSKTNNPSDGWWTYGIPGNTSNANDWLDYPNIGVSNNELYISGNMFTNAGQSDGNVLFQIPKQAGYDGGNLQYQYWPNVVDGEGNVAFTLVPASFGQQGNYGPGIYLVSNNSSGSNKVYLHDLTNDMSSGNETIDSYWLSTTTYSPGANGNMQGSSDLLNTGDNRVQNAFYLNGFIHFVFNSDIGGSWNGINYNRMDLNAGTNTSSTFGLQGSQDYCYPSVVSFATSSNDKSVMIGFLASGQNSYPSVRVVNCDNNMSWSNSVQVKAGEGAVDIQGNEERWGDYSAMGRKHNASAAEVWMVGCYGVPGNAGANNTYNAWVAQIKGTGGSNSIDETDEKQFNVYPNPVVDLFSIEFELDKAEMIDISIYNINGELVKLLYKDKTKTGLNKLYFNKNALSAGIYNLIIKNEKSILKNEKIVVTN